MRALRKLTWGLRGRIASVVLFAAVIMIAMVGLGLRGLSSIADSSAQVRAVGTNATNIMWIKGLGGLVKSGLAQMERDVIVLGPAVAVRPESKGLAAYAAAMTDAGKTFAALDVVTMSEAEKAEMQAAGAAVQAFGAAADKAFAEFAKGTPAGKTAGLAALDEVRTKNFDEV